MHICCGNIEISDSEIEIQAIRAQGSGGQNVNKVSSAIHLRFDISQSSLPQHCKERLMQYKDRRINKDGVIVIKAQRYRDQEKNLNDAKQRLVELIEKALQQDKPRIPTKPTRNAKRKRLEQKTRQGLLKQSRRKVPNWKNQE